MIIAYYTPKPYSNYQSLYIMVRLLGGSWVVISGRISRVSILITHIRGLIALLMTTHEPSSMFSSVRFRFIDFRV